MAKYIFRGPDFCFNYMLETGFLRCFRDPNRVIRIK